MTYKKLVRDGIPSIISSYGQKPITRVLDEAEYQTELRKKLIEESIEVQNADEFDIVEEIADVLEVLHCIANISKVDWSRIENRMNQKKSLKGGFDGRIFLEKVVDRDGKETE